MDPYEQIELGVDAGVATITLNRPDRMNAFTQQMGTELLDAFDRTDADDDVRAVIVTGAGARSAPAPTWRRRARRSTTTAPTTPPPTATSAGGSRYGCSPRTSR